MMFSAIRLKNIQSFEDVTFHMGTGVNVLSAPNETGKSIIFKVCRLMCDANWYGRGEAKTVIRRGCDSGIALFSVQADDGAYIIIFHLYKTYQTYELRFNNEVVDRWKQNTLPEEIRSVLGWRYDSSSKILLNLCDQELDMPFVNSNERYNFEALRFITQDQALERSRENIAEWIKELAGSYEKAYSYYNHYNSMASAIEHIDTVKLSDSLERCEKLEAVATQALTLIKALNGCLECEKPEEPKIDGERAKLCVDRSLELRELGLQLQNALTLEKPEMEIIDSNKMDSLIDQCKILNILKYNLYELSKAIDSHKEISEKIEEVAKLKKEFEEEHKICPLCGNKFGGVHCE